MNALELTNQAIRDAGVSLVPMTSATWTTPVDPMHRGFKDWVIQAWEDIQAERLEWDFMSRSGVTILSPRIYVENGNRATAPPASSTFSTEDTGVTFTVVGTTTLSGAWASGTATAYIDLLNLSGQYKFNEDVNELTPTPADDICVIKNWGRYDLGAIFTDLDEANLGNFYIQSTGGSTLQDNPAGLDMYKMEYVPWAVWRHGYEGMYGTFGTPRFYTVTPDGTYDFWPRLSQQMVLKLTYSATPQTFTAYDDEPTGLPSHYHSAIVWRAVTYYAQYDRSQDVEIRAIRRFNFVKRLMDKKLKPPFTMARSLYDG